MASDAGIQDTPQPEPRRTSRDEMFESLAVLLMRAGIVIPVPDFVQDVRATAGVRISPREILVAVSQMEKTSQPISAEAVAQLVAETRGERSQRQHRFATDWRALGALLTLRGLDGSPEGQRAFIGEARHHAGRRPSDLEILRVAIAAAELGIALDTAIIGKVTRRLSATAGRLSHDELRSAVQHEVRMLRRESTRGMGRISGTAGHRSPATGAVRRTWRPGGRKNRSARRGLRKPG